MNKSPNDVRNIIFEYELPKDKMDEVIEDIEHYFELCCECDGCKYDGFTMNKGNDGDFCYKCWGREYPFKDIHTLILFQ